MNKKQIKRQYKKGIKWYLIPFRSRPGAYAKMAEI